MTVASVEFMPAGDERLAATHEAIAEILQLSRTFLQTASSIHCLSLVCSLLTSGIGMLRYSLDKPRFDALYAQVVKVSR